MLEARGQRNQPPFGQSSRGMPAKVVLLPPRRLVAQLLSVVFCYSWSWCRDAKGELGHPAAACGGPWPAPSGQRPSGLMRVFQEYGTFEEADFGRGQPLSLTNQIQVDPADPLVCMYHPRALDRRFLDPLCPLSLLLPPPLLSAIPTSKKLPVRPDPRYLITQI